MCECVLVLGCKLVSLSSMNHVLLVPCSFLLDQLMRYEAVVLSGGEETDYSSEDETSVHPVSTAEQPVR